MNISSQYNQGAAQYSKLTGSRPAIPKDESAKVYSDPTELNGTAKTSGWLDAYQNGELKVFSPQSIEDYNEHLRSNVATAMDRLGIVLGDDETIQISIGADKLITIGGLKDQEKADALTKQLNTARMVSTSGRKEDDARTKNLYDNTFYINSEYAGEAEDFIGARNRADLIRLKNTAGETIRGMTGVEVDFSRLHRDENGNVAGYPDELAWIFTGDYDPAPLDDAGKSRSATATAVNSIVNRLLDAGYDAIPAVADLGVTFTFTGNDLRPAAPVDVEA